MKISSLIKRLEAIQKKEKDKSIVVYVCGAPVTEIKCIDHKKYYKKGMAGTVYEIE